MRSTTRNHLSGQPLSGRYPGQSGIVLLPALNLDVVLREGGEGFDEGLGKAHVGHQRCVVVDGATTYAITIGQLSLGVVLRHVDDKVELVGSNHVHDVVLSFLVGPQHRRCVDSIFVEETCRATLREDNRPLGSSK